MQINLKHIFGFMSLIAVICDMCKIEEKQVFYTKCDSKLDQCHSRDTLIVLSDLNATGRNNS